MKNKERPKSDSIFKKKGFYVALYASLGVMVVLAAVISMRSFDMIGQNEPVPSEQALDLSQYSQTNQSNDESYLAKRNQDQTEPKQNDVQVKLGDPKATAKPTATPAPAARAIEKATETPVTAPSEKPTASQSTEQPVAITTETPADSLPMADTQDNTGNSAVDNDQANDSYESAYDPEAVEELGDPVFNAYTEEYRMEWPVLGEIVMNYSMDRTTYDKTLDQYRTNDNICISAPAGTPVKSSAEGVVTKVENTRTNGNTVVIDNGNGWMTTYSQLQDGVLVKVGDVVNAGQVLGGVGNPSIYGVLLGNHLNFKITKDDRLVDPLSVLMQ